MQISNEHLNTFKELYGEKYGVSLERSEAAEIAQKVLRLVEIVLVDEEETPQKTIAAID